MFIMKFVGFQSFAAIKIFWTLWETVSQVMLNSRLVSDFFGNLQSNGAFFAVDICGQMSIHL